jgi:hypothetical protein
MRRSLRLAALVVILALAFWIPTNAHADDPYCGDIQGTVCTQPGYFIVCYITYGDYAICTCDGGTHSWWC